MGLKVRDGSGILSDDQGHKVSFTISTNSENNQRIDMAGFVATDLRAIGMEVNMLPLSFNLLVQKVDATFDWECLYFGLTGSREPLNGGNVWKSSGRMHLWWPFQKTPGFDWEKREDDIFETSVSETRQKQTQRNVSRVGRHPVQGTAVHLHHDAGAWWRSGASSESVSLAVAVADGGVSQRAGNLHPGFGPMIAYIARRLLFGAILLFFSTIVSFAIIKASPGLAIVTDDPQVTQEYIEKMQRMYGYDQPAWKQYRNWLGASHLFTRKIAAGAFSGESGPQRQIQSIRGNRSSAIPQGDFGFESRLAADHLAGCRSARNLRRRTAIQSGRYVDHRFQFYRHESSGVFFGAVCCSGCLPARCNGFPPGGFAINSITIR